jgi:hypothetical protein
MLLCAACTIQAADDTLPRGTSLFTFSYQRGDAEKWFGAEQEKVPLQLDGLAADYQLDWTELDYAYGWSDDLAFIFRASQGTATLKGPQSSIKTSGIAGYYVGVRQRLNLRGTGTRLIAETGVLFNEEGNDPLPLSSGGIDYIALMSYNQDFLPTESGFEMDFGYRFRTQGPADEIFFNTSLKLSLLKFVLTKLYYQTTESEKDRLVSYSTLEYPLERGYQLGGVQFSRRLNHRWELSLGYESLFQGRNVFDTSGFRVGLSWWR